MGIVGEVAREYVRLQNELGPRPAVALDEEGLRQQRIKEQDEQERHERAVFTVQYHKLLNQAAYVQHVWRRMEECGYFDEEEIRDDIESHPDGEDDEEGDSDGIEVTKQSLHDDIAHQLPEGFEREEVLRLRRSTRKRRSAH